MPEGDTIHQLARSLRPGLVGKTLRRASLREKGGVEHVVGATVTAVEAVGKHLLIELDSGRTLRTHLGMVGSWRRCAPGERRWSAAEARVELETDDEVFACIRPPTVELFPTRERSVHPVLASLGPDLLVEPVDLDEVLGRAARRAQRPVGELLLDQRVAAGIGNVIKCEALFLAGLDPFRRAETVTDSELRGLYRRSGELLRANLRPGPRITTLGPEGARLRVRGILAWVYDRSGKPCYRCGTNIRWALAGDPPRHTWWCPSCQV